MHATFKNVSILVRSGPSGEGETLQKNITFFISITVVRSVYIQLLRPQDKSIVDVRPVKGPRGSILDRNGIQLAYDVNLYDLY